MEPLLWMVLLIVLGSVTLVVGSDLSWRRVRGRDKELAPVRALASEHAAASVRTWLIWTRCWQGVRSTTERSPATSVPRTVTPRCEPRWRRHCPS